MRSYLVSARGHGIRATDAIHAALAGKPWLPVPVTAVNRDFHFDDDGRLARINFHTTPPNLDEESAKVKERQGFEIIGNLSEMYSTYFNLMTLTEAGKIRQLRQEPDPGVLADLIPSDYWSSPGRDLPIWGFVKHPAAGPASNDATGL